MDIKLTTPQSVVWNDPRRFRVLLAGRRFGKCLEEHTIIQLADGSQKFVKDMQAGDVVLTINENTFRIEPKPVKHLHDNGVRPTLTIRTPHRGLTATPNHPVMCNRKWTNIQDVKVGDLIAVPKKTVFGNHTLPRYELAILAIWLAEGSKYSISNCTPAVLDLLDKSIDEMNKASEGKYPPLSKWTHDGVTWHIGSGARDGSQQAGTKNAMRGMLEKHGVWGLASKTKFVPDEIFRLNKDDLAFFINIFFSCDGSVYNRKGRYGTRHQVELGLANEYMINQFASLLHKFGIKGTITHKIHKKNSLVTGEPFQSWQLFISEKDNYTAFANEISVLGREDALKKGVDCLNDTSGTCNYYLPLSYEEAKAYYNYTPVGEYRKSYNSVAPDDAPSEFKKILNSWRKQTPERITVKRFDQLKHYLQPDVADMLLGNDVVWEEVKEITDSGERQTYDLTIEDNHNFIANGIVTHNTVLALAWLIKKADEKENTTNWYIAPNYQMAKNIAWRQLKRMLEDHPIKTNEAELTIEFPNGSVIQLKSGENPDSLRGSSLYSAVLDEAGFMVKEVWMDSISPATSDQQAPVLFISSPPSNYNWFTDLYLSAKDDPDFVDDWAAFQFSTLEGGNVSAEEIERAKKQLDAKTFRREYLATIETMGGRVYSEFNRSIHVSEDLLLAKDVKDLYVGIDFNVSPMTAVIATKPSKDQLHIVDEIKLMDSNTYELGTELRRRYPNHEIHAYPDPAGRHRKTVGNIGQTDFVILESFGFKVFAPRKIASVQDGINTVQAALRTADGRASLYVHPKCRNLITSFERFVYKDGTAIPDKSGGYDHMMDCTRYLCSAERPILQAIPKFDIKFAM